LIDPAFSQLAFPPGFHYDALRGLEHMRAAGVTPDARVDEAIELVCSKRDADGRWPLEKIHEVEMVNAGFADLDLDMGERLGQPSRWNTLRVMRVLDLYDRGR
jgi:hypothetical protein